MHRHLRGFALLVFLSFALFWPVALFLPALLVSVFAKGLLLLLGLGLLLPLLGALPSVLWGPARLLENFRAFGLLLGSRERRRIARALLLAGVLLGVGPSSLRPGMDVPRAGKSAPPQEEASSLPALRLAAALLWGGAFLLLWHGKRGLGGKSYGDARFERIGREFGDRRRAVGALLVRRRETRLARRQFVRPLTPASTKLVFLTWDQLSRHLLVVGASGAGKTSGFFNHLMLSARVPWIYQDQKAELPLKERFSDRPLWGLDSRGHETRSAVWNPLDEVRGPGDVDVLAALLFPDRPGDQNLWVVRGARRIFGALLKLERHPSLQSLAWSLENESPEDLTRRLRSGSAATLADPRTRGHYLSELLEVLGPWTSSRIARITQGPSTVTLEAFMRGGGYVLGNEAELELRGPLTAFWGLLLHRLRNRPSGAPRLLLLLDEFGDAGRIPHMAQALALYRAKQVALVAGIQSYALLESVYRGEWKAVRDGFGTVFVLTANLDRGLAERLGRELGQFTRRRASWSIAAQLGASGTTLGPSFGSGPEIGVRLVSRDGWGAWSDARACLARAAWPTFWVPCPVEIEPTPLGAKEEVPSEDWRALDAKRLAALTKGARPGDARPPAPEGGVGVPSEEAPSPGRESSPEPWRVF
jgi:hypothetical protein